MSKNIICFDFDGTLVDSQGRIHPRDIEILNTEDRAIFIPATARLLPSVRKAFERNGLFGGQPIPFPLVLLNGAALYRSGEILQAEHPFPEDIRVTLTERMLAHPQVTFWLYSLSEVHVLWSTPVMEKRAQHFDLNTHPFTPASQDRQFTKVVCIAETVEPIQAFAAEIAELDLETSYSLPTAMEINQKGINKGTGLATLLEALELTQAKIFAAGDGENDLPLFDLAAFSFAPATSPPAICARADRLIDLGESGLLLPILQQIGLNR